MQTATSQTTCCHISPPLPSSRLSLKGVVVFASGQPSWQCLYVFLESRFPVFSDFITLPRKSLSYTIIHCCDVAISSMEAHLSLVHSTADIMGSLCVYLLILAPKGLWLLEKHAHSLLTGSSPLYSCFLTGHWFFFLIGPKLHHVK